MAAFVIVLTLCVTLTYGANSYDPILLDAFLRNQDLLGSDSLEDPLGDTGSNYDAKYPGDLIDGNLQPPNFPVFGQSTENRIPTIRIPNSEISNSEISNSEISNSEISKSEISKTQPSIRDQEMIQHSSLWGHQFVQGGAGEGDQRLKPDGSLENIQVVKTDRGLPAYCDPPNPCPIGYSSDDFDCLEEFENSASFSREYQSSQECMCDQEHMFDCPMRGGASERDAESQLDTLARSLANNGDLSALIGNEKRVLIGDAKFGDAKFGDADHRVVAKKYFSEDEHQKHLAELKGKTTHVWRSKVKRTESVDEKNYPWLNGEMTPQVMAKKSPEFYER